MNLDEFQGPLNHPWVTWLWVIFLSAWGGFLAYATRVKEGEKFLAFALFVDLVGAAFAGVIVFLVAEDFDISPYLTAASVGMAGHLGPRSVIVIVKRTLEKKLG